MNKEKRTAISITIETKNKLESVYYSAQLLHIKTTQKKLTWDKLLNKLADNYKIVGGTLLCQATF